MKPSPIKFTLAILTIATVSGPSSLFGQQAFAGPAKQTVSSTNSKLRDLKYRAREYEDNGDARRADQTLLQALDEAKKSGDKLDVLEILSLLIRERTFHDRIFDTDEPIQEAVNIVKQAGRSKTYNPEMAVHLDDVADALYSRGENSPDDQVKDFCAKRYLDVLLPLREFNQLLVGRASQIGTSFAQRGKWKDAVAVSQDLIEYWKRTKPNDYLSLAFMYLVLGNNCLGAKMPSQAVSAYNESLNYTNKIKPDPAETAMIHRKSSQALAIAGKLDDAKKLCTASLQEHISCSGANCTLTAWDAFVLGGYEQQSENQAGARNYYQQAYDDYRKASTPALDAPNNSTTAGGLLLSAEKLAEVTTNSSQKSALLKKAKEIRAKHPTWAKSSSTEETEFFRIYGYVPFPLASIPTRYPRGL